MKIIGYKETQFDGSDGVVTGVRLTLTYPIRKDGAGESATSVFLSARRLSQLKVEHPIDLIGRDIQVVYNRQGKPIHYSLGEADE